MKIEFLEILRCPVSEEKLEIHNPVYENDEIKTGFLISKSNNYTYPIINFIPRFVPETNYADNFGMQWNRFSQTLLDSFSGHPISADRFWKSTGWNKDAISNNWILDVGCGAGRFAEIALEAGSKVVALDFSNSVDACYKNLKHFNNLHVIQADIYAIPLQKNFFPFIYSLGVLQHTPNVAKAFSALPKMVKKDGALCTDYYWKRLSTMLHSKYLFRPITKRMNQDKLFKLLEKFTPGLLRISKLLDSIPFFGKYLKRLIPVANYIKTYPLNENQIKEWALMDTFDMLAPKYDNPQNERTIKNWMKNAGFKNIQIFHSTLLVARGTKNQHNT